MRSPAQALAEWVVSRITRPRQEYRRYVFNDPEKLKSRIRPGDVVLVDGDQRVSQVVKYLTMSPWSHSAIFVGSRFLRDPAQRAETRRQFGAESRYLIVEALVDRGVVVSPLVKYIDFNIRVCRPIGLTPEQIKYRARRGGRAARLSLRPPQHPGSLPLPASDATGPHAAPGRRPALRQRQGHRDDLLVVSRAGVQRVGLTILPLHIRRRAVKRSRLRERIFGRPTRTAYSGFLKARHPSLCVPQDFDLSPNFDVVKFNGREPVRFPYVRED